MKKCNSGLTFFELCVAVIIVGGTLLFVGGCSAKRKAVKQDAERVYKKVSKPVDNQRKRLKKNVKRIASKGKDYAKRATTSARARFKKLNDKRKAPKAVTYKYEVKTWKKDRECLWNIAGREYGNPRRWTEIYYTNKNVIGDNPHLIHPGQMYNLEVQR